MGFRLGIGGGLGPFRGGISTRGIGVGLGPISAGTSFRGRRRSSAGDGAGLAALLGLCPLVLALVWPYLLGAWLAVELGAEEGGTETQIVGGVFEGMYVVAAVAIYLGYRANAARKRRIEAIQTDLKAWETLGREARLAASGLRSGQTEFTFEQVSLMEPRVAYRNGPKVPKVVDQGRASVSPQAISFLGSTKSSTWPCPRLERVLDRVDHLAFQVKGRKTISGVQTRGRKQDVVGQVIKWAWNEARGTSVTDRIIAELDGIEISTQEPIDRLRQELADLNA